MKGLEGEVGKKEGQITNQLGGLEEGISRLKLSIENLQKDLSPVSRSNPTAVTESNKEADVVCEIAERIRLAKSCINSLVEEINEIRDRLEL